MKKLLAAIFAGLFAISVTAPVIAAEKKDGKATAAAKKDGKASKKKDGKATADVKKEGKKKGDKEKNKK